MTSDFSTKVRRDQAEFFREIPGPKPSWLVGNLPALSVDWPWLTCAKWARTYGGLFKIQLGSTPALVVSDPRLIREILCDRWQDFHKAAPHDALAPVITRESLFISNLPHWTTLRQHHPLHQVDSRLWYPRLVEPLRQTVRRQLQAWIRLSRSSRIDLHDQMQFLTFQAFGQANWGGNVPTTHYRWFQTLARTGSWRMMLPDRLLPWMPLGPFFRAARRWWYSEYDARVRAARQEAPTPATAPHDLLRLTLQQGTILTDPQLTEALATNYFGGVFSCSSALNTALYYLSRQPDELRRVRAAVQELLPADHNWTLEQLQACEPLEQVIREALRLRPPVPLYFRSSPVDRETTLGPYRLPPNTTLFVMQWFAHCESDYWGDPERFRPPRWDAACREQNPYGSDYFFPFGRGPRHCIGADFACFYLRLALATFLSECELQFPADSVYRQAFFFGVMMPRGLSVKVEPVRGK